MLQVLVDGTSVARAVFPLHASYRCRRSGDAPDSGREPERGSGGHSFRQSADRLAGIEMMQQEMPHISVFAIGVLSQPQVIVNAMRSGAREFIERPTTTTDLLEAFVRLSTAQRKTQRKRPGAGSSASSTRKGAAAPLPSR